MGGAEAAAERVGRSRLVERGSLPGSACPPKSLQASESFIRHVSLLCQAQLGECKPTKERRSRVARGPSSPQPP